MTLMQLIKTVLDDAYGQIPGDASTKDALIKKELVDLSEEYRNLTNEERPPIDYSNPIKRFAYIYKYTVAHADYVRQVIGMEVLVHNLLHQPKVEVACLGGGPGSDLLGILKYMMRLGIKDNSLTCYIFDKERAWGDSWSDVAPILQAPFGLYPIFQQLDVTIPETWAGYHKFLRADLFTLSYFVSELWAIRDRAQPFFAHFLGGMKPGSLLLFVDNNSPAFLTWFDGMAAQNGLVVVKSGSTKLVFENGEEKTDLGIYLQKFDWPKRESNAAYRILRKG